MSLYLEICAGVEVKAIAIKYESGSRCSSNW